MPSSTYAVHDPASGYYIAGETRHPGDSASRWQYASDPAQAKRYDDFDAASRDAWEWSPTARVEHRATDWTYRPSPMEQEPRPIVLDELDAAPRCTCDLSTPTHDPDCPVHQPVFTFDVTE